MSETRFWLIRHAIVDENARAMLYGVMDVALCETSLLEQAPMYQALADRLPRPAAWKITPLSRTRRTAGLPMRLARKVAVKPQMHICNTGQ